MRLKTLVVELHGIERVKSDGVKYEHQAVKLQSWMQTVDGPPCAAVVGERQAGCWLAKQGSTAFEFQFSLGDLPSTLKVKNGSVAYELQVAAEYKNGAGDLQMLRSARPVAIESQWAPSQSSEDELLIGSQVWSGLFGGRGECQLKCSVVDAVYVAGDNVQVRVNVTNTSRVKVSAVNLALVRRLKLFKHTEDGGKLLQAHFERKVVARQTYKHREFAFEDRTVVLDLPTPKNVFTVRDAQLVEVTYVVQVSARGGMFTRAVEVEVPVDIMRHQSYHYKQQVVAEEVEVDEDEAESVAEVEEEDPQHPGVRVFNDDVDNEFITANGRRESMLLENDLALSKKVSDDRAGDLQVDDDDATVMPNAHQVDDFEELDQQVDQLRRATLTRDDARKLSLVKRKEVPLGELEVSTNGQVAKEEVASTEPAPVHQQQQQLP